MVTTAIPGKAVPAVRVDQAVLAEVPQVEAAPAAVGHAAAVERAALEAGAGDAGLKAVRKELPRCGVLSA
jgi:hypothetical protein